MRCLLLYKLPFLVVLTLFMLTGCEDSPTAPQSTASDVGLNRPAPDFTLTDMQGRKVTLSQFRGKIVLLNFWATWCPPCVEEMPSLEQLHQRFKDQGLVLLAVNVEESYQTVSRFLQGKNYSFPILLDTAAEVQNTYQVFRFPETFVIDRNGIIVDRIIGGRDWMSSKTTAMINSLLNG